VNGLDPAGTSICVSAWRSSSRLDPVLMPSGSFAGSMAYEEIAGACDQRAQILWRGPSDRVHRPPFDIGARGGTMIIRYPSRTKKEDQSGWNGKVLGIGGFNVRLTQPEDLGMTRVFAFLKPFQR